MYTSARLGALRLTDLNDKTKERIFRFVRLLWDTHTDSPSVEHYDFGRRTDEERDVVWIWR